MSAAKHHRTLLTIAVLAGALAMVTGNALFAQLQSGNLHGTVRGSREASPLPGVTIELSGLGATLARVSDSQGRFHFLGLAPGSYRLAATLDGFSPVVHESVAIAVGRNTAIDLEMLAAVEEVITVTAESPLLDERKISAGSTITHTELESIPTARDPWVILQSVPGVLTSDVNVGGNKSGFQQGFTGSGSFRWGNTYAMDGVVITDVAAFNSSPTYYDFEAFEEIEVSTGGSDVAVMAGGVTLNMVTKRGTNDWRGSGRYIVADQDWQSGLNRDPGELGAGQEQFKQGNRIVRIEEYGVEGGGPLSPDRLWAWGFYGRNDIDRLTIADVRDFTKRENYGLKLNAQISSQNSAVAFFHYGNKVVNGRGAGPERPQPTTHDQDGPSGIYKLEDTQLLGPRFSLTGLLSYVDGGFSLTPQGGIDGPNTVLDEDFVWQNNFYYSDTDRDQKQATVDGAYFFSTGGTGHELRLGAGYRRADTYELFGWPGDVVRYDYFQSSGDGHNIAEINRPEVYSYRTDYLSLFAQETLRTGRLTVNLGLRFDRQKGYLEPASAPGVPGFEFLPDGTPLLPAISYDGRDQDFVWDDLAPRLGLTWALDDEHQTLLRASYSRFAAQMDQDYQWFEWPLGPSWAGFFYEDLNGDSRVTADEIIGLEDGPIYTNGYDPLARRSLYDVDPALEAASSDEVILAVEQALMPEFVVGLSATWRNQRQLDEFERLVIDDGSERPHARSDYVLAYVRNVTLPDGSPAQVEVYGLRDGIEDSGRQLVKNGDRETDYLGLNLTLHKRLSKHWMLRGHASWSEWTWSVPENEREDPNFRNNCAGCDDDGGPVYQSPMTPGWSYRLGGLVQIAPEERWGFDVAGNVWGRQGYALNHYKTEFNVFARPRLNLQAVQPLDAYRLPDVHLVDLGITKTLRFGDFETSLAIDCFNVLNRSTVLARNSRLAVATTDWVQEVMNPRIFRLSMRLSLG